MSLKDHTPEYQLNIAWVELQSAVNARDPKRCMSLLFWIKSLIKKMTVLMAFIAIFAMGGFMVHPVFAQDRVAQPDSSVSSVGGAGASLDVGVPNESQSIYFECGAYLSENCLPTLISTSTSYTILSYAIYDQSMDSFQPILSCGGNQLPGYPLLLNAESNGLDVSVTMNGQYHCSGNLTMVTTDMPIGFAYADYIFVQYVPYDTRLVAGGATTGTTTATLADVSFGLSVIIVILFLMVVGMFYNNMSKKKPWR